MKRPEYTLWYKINSSIIMGLKGKGLVKVLARREDRSLE